MIVIAYGVEKSGSTLGFEMAKAVLSLNGFEQVRLPDELVNTPPLEINQFGPCTAERIASLIEYTKDTWIVVKTHHPPQIPAIELLEHIDAGDAKIQVSYREPRGHVLAMLDWYRERTEGRERVDTLEAAVKLLQRRLGNLRRWGSFPSLKLQYDEFAFDRVRGPKIIAEHLGVTVDPEEVWAIVNHASTKRNVARPHRYRTEMSARDLADVEAAFSEYLRLTDDHDLSWFGWRPRRAAGLETQDVDDGLIVMQRDRDRAHHLNAVAAVVLELCDGRMQHEIAELVGDLWDLPEPPHGEVESCLRQLHELQLIS